MKARRVYLRFALRRVESLSPKEQDAIASHIIETLHAEEAWNRSFAEDPSVLRSLAREALEEHRSGETRSLDIHLPKVSEMYAPADGRGVALQAGIAVVSGQSQPSRAQLQDG